MLTVKDAEEYLMDYLSATSTVKAARNVYRAISDSLYEVANAHRWSYYYTHGRIVSSEKYNTGTIEYTHSTRSVTLSGGTWPSWVVGAVLVISDIEYRVASRTSNSVVVLDAQVNPGQDLSAGTKYAMYLDRYTLPVDFKSVAEVHSEPSFWGMEYIQPKNLPMLNRCGIVTGDPRCYTIMGDPLNPGRMMVQLWPYPEDVKTYDFVYQRRPRPITVREYSEGTADVSASSVTGISTSFTDKMIGSVFRLSENSTAVPTDITGSNPAVVEEVIAEVGSSTSLTLKNSAGVYSGKKYMISDPIDIEQGAMQVAFLRCMEKNLSFHRTMDVQQRAWQIYQEALEHAKAADSRSFAGVVCGESKPTFYEDVTVKSEA